MNKNSNYERSNTMAKKNIDWGSIGFSYIPTDKRYVANFKDGKWDGGLTSDPNVVINECAGVLQYSQSCFEGLKAYTTEDGRTVCFRPDLNAARMKSSCERLKMPVFPEDKFVEAVKEVVKANIDYVPPYGSGATLYIRPYMFGSNPVIGVKPADEYQFRIFVTPVGPYFKGGAKPITIRVTDLDRAAPRGTGHIKAGLNYAMSLYNIVDAHENGFDENLYVDPATRTKVEEIGLNVEEREVYLSELSDFAEMGLCGTAAVISPVGKIYDHGKEICFPSGMDEMGPTIKKLYDTLTGIQMGRIEAPEGWIVEIK